MDTTTEERREAAGPAFQGGQGRSAEEVEASAALGGVALLGIVAAVFILWVGGC